MRRGALLLATAMLVSSATSCGGKDEAACQDPTTSSAVEMTGDGYAPACVQASVGTDLTILNTGQAPHTYTVIETELEARADPGGQASLSVTDVTPGTYEVICTLHPEMRAALRIV